jgi:hypothetical protein
MAEPVNFWRAPPALQALIRHNRDLLWRKCGGDDAAYRARLGRLKARGFPI